MLFTPEMAEAFGDRLECTRLQHALAAALPEVAGAVTVDDARPLLRIARAGGGALLVARAADEADGRWLVGIPGAPDPVVRAAGSPQEVLEIVRRVMDGTGDPDGGTDV